MIDLVEFASKNGLSATRAVGREEQKALGQFMTPPAIARAMARQACKGQQGSKCVRVLEPAAGSGVLAAATLEAFLEGAKRPERIEFNLCEFDQRLMPSLQKLAKHMREAGRTHGIEVVVRLKSEDFLLSSWAAEQAQFDLVIANPPYFKLAKKDPRSQAHSYAVHGQPNIYGLFMAATARTLAPQASWCFITPRSWTNGPYFTEVRRHLLKCLHIDAIHVFESRQDHFAEDEILQEAMITWGTAQAPSATTIVVSTSQGARDLHSAQLNSLAVQDVIAPDQGHTIALPTKGIPSQFKAFKATLATYGLKVSTGPVVAFRAAELLSDRRSRGSVPLLWMQHITHMRVSWPIQKKREHIKANASNAWLLVSNANMVVMRRFSPKEDARRITAAPYIEGDLPGSAIGLENHTNYLSRPGGAMAADEVRGLAAYLNSRAVDQYLRCVSGNTQINASDLRNLPLPPMKDILAIGRALPANPTLDAADTVVEHVLGLAQAQQVANA